MVDLEINRLTKILFVATAMLSLLLLVVKVEEGDDGATGSVSPHKFLSVLQGFSGPWFVYLIRYIILFSYIIPIRWVAHPHPSHTLHPYTLIPSHPYTLTPLHPHTLTPSHPHTLHPYTLTPSHPHTLTPSHPHTSHPHTVFV